MGIGVIGAVVALLAVFRFHRCVAAMSGWCNLTVVCAGLTCLAVLLLAQIALFTKRCLQHSITAGPDSPSAFG